MPALSASDVTYTGYGRSAAPIVADDGMRRKHFKITFGDGVKTYPSGGVPLSGLAAQGFPYVIEDVIIEDMADANGYVYKWNYENNTLIIYQSAAVASTPAAAGPMTEFSTAAAPAATTLHILVMGH